MHVRGEDSRRIPASVRFRPFWLFAYVAPGWANRILTVALYRCLRAPGLVVRNGDWSSTSSLLAHERSTSRVDLISKYQNIRYH
jgi:hypothetical protein